MKILILANNDVGLYKFRKELITELLLENEVFISLPDGDFIKRLKDLGCSFINTPLERRGTNVFKDYKLYKSYKKIIKNISPDLVITYTIKPNIYGGLACRRLKIKYVANITGLGTSFQKKGFLKRLVLHLYKKSLKQAHTVFFENSTNMEVFVKNSLIEEKQAFLLNGAGVNLDDYKLLPYPADNGITDFLFVGRVMREKGVGELLLACKQLASDNYSFRLHVVGEFEENYKQEFEIYNNESWFVYHGFQANVIPFIEQCHCFVLPSWHEGMANTILENAASGRPVIATDIPGCKESVKDGETGFLCKVKDFLSLYEVMKKVLNMSHKEKYQMGLLGRQYMKEKFDKKIIVKVTLGRIFDYAHK